MKPPNKLKPLDIHELGAELPTNSGRNNFMQAFQSVPVGSRNPASVPQFELSPDSSFNIIKWPETKKNQKSKYLMKEGPPMIDLSKNSSVTPKLYGNSKTQSLQHGALPSEMS